MGVQPGQAAVSPLSIDLGAAQEKGVGGDKSYWDLQKNMAVDFGRGEILFLFGDMNTRLIYKGGEGGGFMDIGQISKPVGDEKIQIIPQRLSYNDTEYIKTGHFYVLKTFTLGYFAVYIDDIQAGGNDYPYLNFTIYKLKGEPVKVAAQSQPQQLQNPSQSPAPSENNDPGQDGINSSSSGEQTIKYMDGAEYIGEVSDSVPNGAGTMTWLDGAVYRGEWINGKQDGDGTITYASGDKYIGEWKNGLINGWGIYIWVNGDKYDGNWEGGKRSGQGKLIRSDGTISEGLWKNDNFMNNNSVSNNNSNPAQNGPTVMLNGKMLAFDVPPLIENGRTLVPLRRIFESLGALVGWDNTTQTVTATKGNIQIKLQIGGQSAFKNGAAVRLDVPAKIIGGRTLVPLRFVSESLGAQVGWDNSTRTISINNSDNGTTPSPVGNNNTNTTSPSISTTGAAGQPYWVENGVRVVLGGKIVYEDQNSIYSPFISHDGSWVVYSHNQGELLLASLNGGSAKAIYQLGADEEEDYGVEALGWSPDNSRILFMTFHRGGFTGGNKLMIFNRKTGGTSLVLKGLSSASWSADGRIVTNNSSTMKVVDESGRTIKELTVPEGGFFVNADHPSFTPDGTQVVYNLSNEYYLHDIQNDSYEKIFSLDRDLNGEDYPRVAGDGKIIFADNKGKLYIYDSVKEAYGIFYDKARCSYPNWK